MQILPVNAHANGTAVGWVDYCNPHRTLPTPTSAAKTDKTNHTTPVSPTFLSSPKPYTPAGSAQVKCWALGSDTWGGWQVEQLYAKKSYQ